MTDLSAEDRARAVDQVIRSMLDLRGQQITDLQLDDRIAALADWVLAFEAAAIERAAQVADGWLQLAHDGHDLTGYGGENRIARGIAQEIRSLSTDGGGGEG